MKEPPKQSPRNQPLEQAQWRFEVRAKVWHWEREGADGTTAMGELFESFIACMVDAEMNGFNNAIQAGQRVNKPH